MEYYRFTGLPALHVKWADTFIGNEDLYQEYHSNPNYEIIMVIEGPIHLQVGDERLQLKSGETFLLQPWEQHCGWRKNAEEASFFWVQFACEPGMGDLHTWTKENDDLNIVHMPRNELRTQGSPYMNQIILPRQFRPRRRYKLLSLFENLLYEYHQPRGYFRMRQSLLLGQILEVIATDLLEFLRKDTAMPLSYNTYRKLISYLDENYEKEITKESVEQFMDRKYEYVSYIFKKNAGLSITAYIQQLRLQRARYLLLNTNRSIQEIAEDIGFRDSLYFSRLFKKATGMSPSHFREQKTSDMKGR